MIILRPADEEPFGLPPVGPGNKGEALSYLLQQLEKVSQKPRICRVPKYFVERHVESSSYRIVRDRDNSDYVYLSENLINLPGNKYHRKKNHVEQIQQES